MRKAKRREPGDYTDGKKFGDNAWNRDLPFGTKSVKRQADNIRERHPGPGQYDPSKSDSKVHNRVQSADFKRYPKDKNSTKSTPGPGAYDVEKSDSLTKCRVTSV